MSMPLDEYLNRASRSRKYRNEPMQFGGHRFASKKEAARYQDLILLQRAGAITGLSIQPRFRLEMNGVHLCDYIGDFEYYEQGARIIEDVKGWRTREYRIKRKLMRAIHGIEVRET